MKFKTLEEAIAHILRSGEVGLSVFRYPRMRTVYVGRTNRPDAWKYEGCQVLWEI